NRSSSTRGSSCLPRRRLAPWAGSSARSARESRCRSARLWRSNASCSNSCFKAKTPTKGWRPTSRSGRRISKRSSRWSVEDDKGLRTKDKGRTFAVKIALSVSEKEKAKGADSPYFKALVAAGARPDELDLLAASDARRVRANDLDGLLFAGGEDVDPSFYGEEKKYESVHVDRARDEFEMALL